MNTTIRSNF